MNACLYVGASRTEGAQSRAYYREDEVSKSVSRALGTAVAACGLAEKLKVYGLCISYVLYATGS